jgi:hypothetical protein
MEQGQKTEIGAILRLAKRLGEFSARFWDRLLHFGAHCRQIVVKTVAMKKAPLGCQVGPPNFKSIQDYAVRCSSFFRRAVIVAGTKSMTTLNSSTELGFGTVVVVRWANEKRLQTGFCNSLNINGVFFGPSASGFEFSNLAPIMCESLPLPEFA